MVCARNGGEASGNNDLEEANHGEGELEVELSERVVKVEPSEEG
jgi:hypothetical protein